MKTAVSSPTDTETRLEIIAAGVESLGSVVEDTIGKLHTDELTEAEAETILRSVELRLRLYDLEVEIRRRAGWRK